MTNVAAMFASISAAAYVCRSGENDDFCYAHPEPKKRQFPDHGWLARIRLKRLLRLIRKDAARKALGKKINERRNSRRWDAYFSLLERRLVNE